jgi:hypothetical protein
MRPTIQYTSVEVRSKQPTQTLFDYHHLCNSRIPDMHFNVQDQFAYR